MNVKRFRSRTYLIVSLAVGLVAAGSILASGAIGGHAVTPEKEIAVPALQNMAVFARAYATRDDAIASNIQEVAPLLEQGGPNVPSDWLPGAAQGNRARALLNTRGRVVFAFPTSKGRVCSGLSGFGAGCLAGFTADHPVSLTYGDPAAGEPGIIWGMAPDSVKRVQVIVGGVPEDATMGENAYFYQGTASSREFAGLVVTFKDGSSQTISLPAAPPEAPIK